MTSQEFLDALPTSVFIQGQWLTNSIKVDHKPLNLEGSLLVRNHSPTGFNWGYGGSGPAQFALALLLLYVDPTTALRHYQDFKFGWVAQLPQKDFQGSFNLRMVWEQILDKKKEKI